MKPLNYYVVAIGWMIPTIYFDTHREPPQLMLDLIWDAIGLTILLSLVYAFNTWAKNKEAKRIADIKKANEEAIGWKGWGK